MNYYQHHIRDYDAATSHLSWDQDLAYTRLIRWYYRKEQPIPADLQEACRQVRATSKGQRAAVATVLREFFELRDDGWHHTTCDDAITLYREGEPEREAKKANEENRLKQHREERARLFKLLTDAGQHAPWNIKIGELRVLVAKLGIGASATPPVVPATQPETLPATAPATPATATQYPIPNTQYPLDVSISPRASTEPGEVPPERDHPDQPLQIDRNVQIAMLLRAQGVTGVNGTHPTVAVTWAQDGRVTDTMLTEAVTKAKASLGKQGRPDKVPVSYLEPIVVQLLAAPPQNAAGDKFRVAGLDHSSSSAAMAASMERHGVSVPGGDVEISFS
jgi:uncharacterized protein YdaU (DUF1376 family)